MERIIPTLVALIALIALGTAPIATGQALLDCCPHLPISPASIEAAETLGQTLNPGVELSGHSLYGGANGRWTTSSQTVSAPDQGDPITLTWGFATDSSTITGAGYYLGPNNETTITNRYIAFLDDKFGNGGVGGADLTTRPWFANFDNGFQYLSNICGIDLVYEPADDGANFRGANGVNGVRADIRLAGAGAFSKATEGTPGIPIGSPVANATGVGSGDVLFNLNNLGFIQQNNFVGDLTSGELAYRNTTMHEVMHTLGVGHNSVNASVPMNISANNTLINPYTTTAFNGVQHLDVLPLQRAYGDVYEKGNGNDTAQSATQIGDISDFLGIGLDGDITFGQVTPNDVDFVSIDGETDTDYYEFTVAEQGAVDIILKPLGLEFTINTDGNVNTSAGEPALDSSMLSDLTLELRDANDTLIAQSNVAGLGGLESIIISDLSPGTYLIKVVGNEDFAQFYSITSTFTPSAQGFQVTAPDGGEVWLVDPLYQYDITWGTTLGGNVKIELLMGGAVSTIAANTPNDGSYIWTIPSAQALADNYRIRVTSLESPDKTDQSAADFSIAQPPLAIALDTTDLSWLSEEPLNWFNQTVTTNDGVDAAQSQDIDDGVYSSMETTLQGPGELSFWWKVSSENGWDFLEFHINDVLQTGDLKKISGEKGWVYKTVVIPAGINTVRWTYRKDAFYNSTAGSDAGWVDQVVFTPDPTPYDIWAGGTFANAFNDTAANSDPDGDGRINYAEFAFGTDPTVSSGTTLVYTPGGSIITNGLPIVEAPSGGFKAVFPRYKEHVAAGLTYTVEFSRDLDLWTVSSAGLSVVTGAGSSGDYEVVSVPLPTGDAGSDAPMFIRVTVSMGE